MLEINSSPPSPPKLASTLGLASGLPTGSIEIDRHSFSEMGGDVVGLQGSGLENRCGLQVLGLSPETKAQVEKESRGLGAEGRWEAGGR